MKINGCEVVRNRGRGFMSYSVYTPRGEHFRDMDTHVHVVYSKQEALDIANDEVREACDPGCDCWED
jgi:hypothetical protein